MTEFKIGDWVKHPDHGIGLILLRDINIDIFYIVFPRIRFIVQNKPVWLDGKSLIKPIPKFDNFEDLFEENEND